MCACSSFMAVSPVRIGWSCVWCRRIDRAADVVSVGARTTSGGDGVLAGTTAGPLAGNDDSCDEELSAPHSPRLAPLERTRQALRADGTTAAQRLGELHVARRLGEEQLRVLTTARQLLYVDARTESRCVEDGGTHLVLLLSRWGVQLRKSERPRIPGFGFRGLEAAGEEGVPTSAGSRHRCPGRCARRPRRRS